ncbi:MAG: prolipoprotein diacylglyceryl transferase [Rubricoccaceae bacterium]|nr:prolipoprotein diacylglyceryl transferase [Rubricoccaceae bacterium]
MVELPVPPHWVVVAILISATVGGFLLVVRLATSSAISFRYTTAFAFAVVALGLFLGRGIHLSLFAGRVGEEHLLSFWKFWEGGYSILGFCLAPASLWYLSRCSGWRIRQVDTLVAATYVALPFAQALGRIGCLLNACCYGWPTKVGPGVVYPPSSIPGMRFGPQELHPVQIYEAVLNGAAFVVLLSLWRRGRNLRDIAGTYFLLYGVLRLAMQMVRADPWLRWGKVDLASVLSVAMIVIGLSCIAWGRLVSRKG